MSTMSTYTMAQSATNLRTPDPLLTLEEAYWKVMATLTEVEDFITQCKAVGHVTRDRRYEADILSHTLTKQIVYLNLIWSSEPDEDKFHNAREWVEIIAKEADVMLTSVNTVMATPGTILRQRQTETHGDLPIRYLQVANATSDVVKRTTIYDNGAPHDTTCGTHSRPPRSARIPPTGSMRTPTTITGHAVHQRTATYPRDVKQGPSRTNCSLPRLMDVRTPLVYDHPPLPTRRDGHHSQGQRKGKRKLHPSMAETQPPAKKRHLPVKVKVTTDTPGGIPKETSQIGPPSIKKEPGNNVITGKEPPRNQKDLTDVKPDFNELDDEKASFLSQVMKGSKRLFIDEYPTEGIQCADATGRKPQPVKTSPTSRTTLTSPKGTSGKHREKKRPQPDESTTVTKRKPETTTYYRAIKVERGDVVTTQQDKPGDTPQTFDDDENEHRKRRRHQLDLDPKLLRWLGRDPTRFPKAREDMARWTRYMATEMSNPAFPLFLSMAGSMARNPARAPHHATTPLTSKHK